jgi:hypothetical protein
MGYDVNTSSDNMVQRHDRLNNRKANLKHRDAAQTLVELSSLFEEGAAVGDTDVDMEPEIELADDEISRLSGRLEQADADVVRLEMENKKVKDENKSQAHIVKKMKATTPEDFANDDDKVRYYTGMKSFISLMGLFYLLSGEISEAKNSALTKFQKMIITLMRLRLNQPIVDLSYRFGVSRSTISKAFLEILDIMNECLVHKLVRWPERDELRETMPMVFRK